MNHNSFFNLFYSNTISRKGEQMRKPIFITAEIGINHNGDISICKELIDVAVMAGCDAVKLQKRDLDQVYTQEMLNSPRESPWGTTQRAQKEGLELGVEDYREIDQYCREKGIEWFASAWDVNSQEFLKQFDLKYNKIASAMIVYKDLLKIVAEEKKHTFISTGMTTYEDIQAAIDIFKQAECSFELMHTISTYPMKDEDANLNMIRTLRDKFKCDVGYSGHEVGLAVSFGAAALGITSLERHITLDRAMYGSDQSASVEPPGLRQLVGSVRKINQAMGDGKKRVIEAEIPIAKKLREHLDWEATH
jgi:N-acetylneuraminate synthase